MIMRARGVLGTEKITVRGVDHVLAEKIAKNRSNGLMVDGNIGEK